MKLEYIQMLKVRLKTKDWEPDVIFYLLYIVFFSSALFLWAIHLNIVL